MDDLAVIVVSYNSADWLPACLESVIAHGEGLKLDLVVVDSGSTDETAELVTSKFPTARLVQCENHGFGHANNRGLMTTDARYLLFLNPDTEVRDGTFVELLSAMDRRPGVGAAGVRQLTPDGEVFPTIRRFPSVRRSFFEAVGSERLPLRSSSLGERELDLSLYDQEIPCDWTSGSFLLARREALDSAGLFDERFFLYSEETDLCFRIKQAGWEIVHLPFFTIVHHADKAGWDPTVYAQETYRATAVHAEALLAAAPGRRHRGARARLRASRDPRRRRSGTEPGTSDLRPSIARHVGRACVAPLRGAASPGGRAARRVVTAYPV